MQKIFASAITQSVWLRYGLAVVLPLLVLLFALIDAASGTIFFPFLVAVTLTAWFGGVRPGLAALVFSILLINYFLLEPKIAFTLESPRLPILIVFAVFGVLISFLQGETRAYAHNLQVTKSQLETILNSISEAVTVQDKTYHPLYANEPAAKLLQFPSPQSMVETSLQAIQPKFERFDAEGNPIPLDVIPSRLAFADGLSHELAYRLRNLETGAEKWIIQKSSAVLDHLGKAQMVVNILHDDTARHEHETQLENERRLLRDVLDNLPALVGVMTMDGKLIEINKVATQLVNLSRENILGQAIDQIYAWSYSETVAQQLRDAIEQAAQGEFVRYDVKIQTANNQFATLDFMLSPIRDANGQIRYLIPAAVDITERKQAELERGQLTLLLAAERQRLQIILDNVPGMVWEVRIGPDGQNTPAFMNNYIEKLYGYTADEWLSRPELFKETTHPDDFEKAVTGLKDAYEKGGGIVSYRMTRRDGRLIHTETRCNVIYDSAGTPIMMAGITMDISEQKEAELLLEQYSTNLKHSNEELQQFAYVASHDLQEPLRMVTSYLQLLEQRYGETFDADAKDFIGFAVDGAVRMKALISDLLAYSRVETGARVFKTFDAQAVLDNVLRDLSISIEEAGATVTFDTLPKIKADEHQIKQLFQNLIGNGIKFRSDDRKPEIHIGVKRQDNDWLFCVRDNGIGIEPQYIARIFVIFQRLHNRSKYPGTGIGLAVCRKVVERHNGKIWVESEVGQGTTFYFTLPMHQA